MEGTHSLRWRTKPSARRSRALDRSVRSVSRHACCPGHHSTAHRPVRAAIGRVVADGRSRQRYDLSRHHRRPHDDGNVVHELEGHEAHFFLLVRPGHAQPHTAGAESVLSVRGTEGRVPDDYVRYDGVVRVRGRARRRLGASRPARDNRRKGKTEYERECADPSRPPPREWSCPGDVAACVLVSRGDADRLRPERATGVRVPHRSESDADPASSVPTSATRCLCQPSTCCARSQARSAWVTRRYT